MGKYNKVVVLYAYFFNVFQTKKCFAERIQKGIQDVHKTVMIDVNENTSIMNVLKTFLTPF